MAAGRDAARHPAHRIRLTGQLVRPKPYPAKRGWYRAVRITIGRRCYRHKIPGEKALKAMI